MLKEKNGSCWPILRCKKCCFSHSNISSLFIAIRWYGINVDIFKIKATKWSLWFVYFPIKTREIKSICSLNLMKWCSSVIISDGLFGEEGGSVGIWRRRMPGLPLRINYTGASCVQSDACFASLARPPRRHGAGVGRAFWASWCSTPPRLDLAGQWKHLAV